MSTFTGLIKNLQNEKSGLTQKVEGVLDSSISKYGDAVNDKNKCPSKDELLRLYNTKVSIESNVVTLKGRVDNIDPIVDDLKRTINIAKGIINTILALPIPNQFTTVGTVLTIQSTVTFIKDIITEFEYEVKSLNYTLNGIKSTIGSVIGKLSKIDNIIENCSNDLNVNENKEFNDIVRSIRVEDSSRDSLKESYKGYMIKVVEEMSNTIAPKRYAKAINNLGVVIYRGEPSFSASIDILKKEVKFYIDNLK